MIKTPRKYKKDFSLRNKVLTKASYQALTNIFGDKKEVCGYSTDKIIIEGKEVYEVNIDINQVPEEYKQNTNKYIFDKLKFPKKVLGIDIHYEVGGCHFISSWEKHSQWSRLRDQAMCFLNENVEINEPYTTNTDILGLRGKHNIIKGGVEINRENSLNRWNATLSFIVWDISTQIPYLLSNAHILCLERFQEHFTTGTIMPPEDIGLSIYQPRYPRKIGELAGWGTQNDTSGSTNVDAAIATIDIGISYDAETIPIIGNIPNKSAIDIAINDDLMMVGRTSGYQELRVYQKNVVIQPSGFPKTLVHTCAGYTVQSGDSGSPVYLKTGNKNPVGIVCANYLGFTAIVPAIYIEEDLGITFTMPTGETNIIFPVVFVVT